LAYFLNLPMSKRKFNTYNYKITALLEQFSNLSSYLSNEQITIISTDLVFTANKDRVHLSWNSNGKETHFSSGDDLIFISQYIEMYYNRMFHFMLKDGSLIRFNYEFKGRDLVSQNLLWWPCPIKGLKINPTEDIDSVIDRLNGKVKAEEIIMRSPLRVDYDCLIDTQSHPLCHMHFENPDTRLALNKPLCIYGFMEFIFGNFYPAIKIDFSKWDKIKLEKNSSNIEYEYILAIR